MDNYRLEKKNRIFIKKEIQALFQSKTKVTIKPVMVFYLENNLGYPRLAISLTRKSGNSVKRNKVKRQIKEFFRLNKLSLGSRDYLFFSRYCLTDFKTSNLDKLLNL